MIFGALGGWRRPDGWHRKQSLILYAGLLLIAFAYFRWAVGSPWNLGQGQTWNQFKIMNWISPVLLTFLGLAVSQLAQKHWRMVYGLLIIWAGVGAYAQVELHCKSMPTICKELGYTYHPLKTYEHLLKELHDKNLTGPILISHAGTSLKRRQLATYFLMDVSLLGDWKDDDYLWHMPAVHPPAIWHGWKIVYSLGPDGNWKLEKAP